MLLTCVCCVLLLNSCKVTKIKDEIKSELNLLSAIPQNSSFVFEIKGKSLIEKGVLNTPERYKFWNKVKEKLTENPEIYKLVNSFLTEEYPLGLDINKLYLFSEELNKYGVALAKIQDKNKLETELKTLKIPEIKDNGHFKSVISDEFSLLWNNEVLFFVLGNLENPEKLVDYSPLNGMSLNPVFVKFTAKQSDLGFWMSYDKVCEIANINIAEKDSIKDTYLYINTNFAQGELELTTSVQNKSGKLLWEEYNITKPSFNKDLLYIYPEKSFFSVVLSVNPEGYLNFLKNHAWLTPKFSMKPEDSDEFKNIAEIIKHFEGDVVLNVYGFSQGMLPLPLAGLNFTVAGERSFKELLSLIPNKEINQNGDYYYMNISSMILYFAYKNKVVMLTNDNEMIKNFIAGTKLPKNLSHSYITQKLDGVSSSVYLNLSIDEYPENIQLAITKTANSLLKNNINLFKDISINSANNNRDNVISLKFKDKTKNSLARILELTDNYFSIAN
ncbi:MAG: DUF4836 family protein [Prevotellaceae bacterium]|nr:DUF4836 family protein [Prevotellaceae bacterium]